MPARARTSPAWRRKLPRRPAHHATGERPMASRPLKQPTERAPGSRGPATGFSFDDVKRLVQLVEESDVTHIAWRRGGEKVVIRRGGPAGPPPASVHFAPAPLAVTSAVGAVHPAPGAPAAARDAKLEAPG